MLIRNVRWVSWWCIGMLFTSCRTPVVPTENLFQPQDQTPFLKKGLVVPLQSIPCQKEDGSPTNDCNYHGSSVTEFPKGEVVISWFHGLGEKSKDSKIFWAKKALEAETFASAEVLVDDPERAEGNSALFVDSKGKVYVFFISVFGIGWSQSRIRLMTSTDQGKTFGPIVDLTEKPCAFMRFPPVEWQGEILLPGYSECLAVPTFIRSSDGFQTWKLQDDSTNERYWVNHAFSTQPSLTLRGDGKLTAILRDGSDSNRILRMESEDFGKTWTPNQRTLLPNPGTSVAQARLKNGHTVVVYNDSEFNRDRLSVALSEDEGKTFTAFRTLPLEDCSRECSYPAVMQSQKDGTLWVSYTQNRQSIGWLQFNEAWILESSETPANIQCLDSEVCVQNRCVTSCTAQNCAAPSVCVGNVCAPPCQDDSSCASGSKCMEGACLSRTVGPCEPK